MNFPAIRQQNTRNSRVKTLSSALLAIICLTFTLLSSSVHSLEHANVEDQVETCCLLGSVDKSNESSQKSFPEQAKLLNLLSHTLSDNFNTKPRCINYVTRAPPQQSTF